MSNTTKDLKSHKIGYGKYRFNKPQRKLTPLALDAAKLSGEHIELAFIENDLNMDDFDKGNTVYHGAKQVKSIRRQLRTVRKTEKSTARKKINKVRINAECLSCGHMNEEICNTCTVLTKKE